MNENRFFLWTKIFIKIKTRDKMKCSQKISYEGDNFHGGKLTPENASRENPPPPRNLSLSPKKKKRKLTPENIIS